MNSQVAAELQSGRRKRTALCPPGLTVRGTGRSVPGAWQADGNNSKMANRKGDGVMTKLHELAKLGQAIWLDYIRRPFIEQGDLGDLVADGLRGVT